MKLLMMAVRDSKSELFAIPVFVRTRGEALLAFAAAVNDPAHDYGKWSEDFAMFEIGALDQATGMVEGHQQPVHVINALSVKVAPESVALKVAR